MTSQTPPGAPSPPLGGERVGVRWGRFRQRGAHLTLPAADAAGPLPLPTVTAGGEGRPRGGFLGARARPRRPAGGSGRARLQTFFRNNGYIRPDTVREPGEFAVRGGIVALSPGGAAEPLRLDFFGDG